MKKELIDVIKVVRIGGFKRPGVKAYSFYLLIPSALRDRIDITENSEFLCYFDEEALIYIPKEKGVPKYG